MNDDVNKALADLDTASAQLGKSIKKLEKALKEMDKPKRKEETATVTIQINYSYDADIPFEDAFGTAKGLVIDFLGNKTEDGVTVHSIEITDEDFEF